jgi:hypothetical protein
MKLVARSIGDDDFEVRDDGEPVGRIRFAKERSPGIWVWHVQIPVPMPSWCNGRAESREAAMAAFRAAWTRFKSQIGPEAYVAAIEEARQARNRFSPKD